MFQARLEEPTLRTTWAPMYVGSFRIGGYNVVVNTTGFTRKEQVRFPRSKRRRIRKKWAKREENYRTKILDDILEIHGVLYMHPRTARRLQDAFAHDLTYVMV